MKKYWKLLLGALALSFTLGMAIACGEEQTANSSSNYSSSSLPMGEVTVLPTAEEIISARENVLQDNIEGYDFTFNFSGELSVLGIGGTVSGNYDAAYRYNKISNETTFKSETSGALLNDGLSYIKTLDAQKLRIDMDEENKVKKVSVVASKDEEITMVNKPMVALIDSLEKENITKIAKSTSSNYDYKATMNLSSDNPYLAKICNLLSALGTNISIKNVQFTNPISGIDLYFNLDNNRLEDFKFSAQIVFPVKLVDVTITLIYEQKGSQSAITLPSVDGLIIGKNDIATELNLINTALNSVKIQEDYSLDLLAKNEFDPGWNKLAIVDKYQARLYKNTIDQDVWFNHSYEYKAHHEEDGAETYKYTIGNINDDTNSVHIVSRKGGNIVTPLTGVTVDTQFDYLTSMVMQTATNVDCIKKEVKNEKTFYYVYLNKVATLAMQDKIIDMINSNEAEGVVDVNNYFNIDNNMVMNAVMVIEMNNGAVSNIKCETELKYVPTGGEYVDYNITLNNQIECKINDKLQDASKYTAPKSTGKIVGLASAGYYIA